MNMSNKIELDSAVNRPRANLNESASRTAYQVALFRSLGRLKQFKAHPNPDTLAQYFLGFPERRNRLVFRIIHFLRGGRLPELLRKFATLHIARTEFFDQACLSTDKQQIVILGAGMDTRPYRLPLQDKVVFEVDIAGTQIAKKARVAKLGLKMTAKSVRYVSTDFNKKSWMQDLIAQGFDLEMPTLFIWEGVSYYLPEQDIKATFEQLDRVKDWAMAFDFCSRDFVSGVGAYDDPFTRRFHGRLKKQGEPFVFGVPENESDWFEKLKLKVEQRIGFEQWVRPLGDAAQLQDFSVARSRTYALVSPLNASPLTVGGDS